MHKISQTELLATHRIFNHIESIIGPYYGQKTLDESKNYVSANRWIMFPDYRIGSLREGAELPIPNMFISFDNEVQDNGAGLLNGWIGMTYHNVQAMLGLDDILKRSKGIVFIDIIKSLGDNWSVEIQHKTKTDSPDSVPRYSTFSVLQPSTITREQIKQNVMNSNKHLLHPGDPYPDGGNPVLWDVTIFVVLKPTTITTFDADVKKSFDLFFKALQI